MIRPPSNLRPYDEFWSGDPAFQQPDPNDAESIKLHAEKVKRARETGNWSELMVAGSRPTKFVMRPVRGEQLRWLHDRSNVSDPEKAMGGGTAFALMFRCALVDVVDLGGDVKVSFVEHAHLGRIASSEIVDYLDAADPSIVTELGALALTRARALNPLS